MSSKQILYSNNGKQGKEGYSMLTTPEYTTGVNQHGVSMGGLRNATQVGTH